MITATFTTYFYNSIGTSNCYYKLELICIYTCL